MWYSNAQTRLGESWFSMEMKPGDWYYSEQHKEPCQLIEMHEIWGKNVLQVWLPARDTVVRLEQAQLKVWWITVISVVHSYIAYAARISSAMSQDVLLAPIDIICHPSSPPD